MSSNRLKYDTCQYQTVLAQNRNSLEYVLYPLKYENCQPCRMQLGIVNGNDVSVVRGDRTDLESDLRGQTRPAAQPGQCPGKLYNPTQEQEVTFTSPSMTEPRTLNLQKNHLQSCQMFPIRGVPAPPLPQFDSCPRPM
tara:strand:+ start:1719 stop:2132 length:414 start_codon:yes stop_codon:yes gene_type:complete